MAGKKKGEPRFSEWVRAYGISKLTRDLGKNRDNRSVVQAWLSRKQRPNGRAAVQLISLSTQHPLGGKPLTFEDIYGYFSLETEVARLNVKPSASVAVARAAAQV